MKSSLDEMLMACQVKCFSAGEKARDWLSWGPMKSNLDEMLMPCQVKCFSTREKASDRLSWGWKATRMKCSWHAQWNASAL
jgi:hypothetical protein